MKVAEMIHVLSTKYKSTDEVKCLIQEKECDIEGIFRKRTDNAKYLQHKALLIIPYTNE